MAGSQKLKSIDAVQARPLQLYLTYRLTTLSAQLNRQAGSVLKKAGNLSVPEWRVVALLALHGEMNGSAIAHLVGFDAGQISRIFRALERRGLITVRRSDEDRRSAYMSLTRTGRALYGRVLPAMQRRQEHLLAALTPQERAAFLLIIDKLQVAAERRDFSEAAQ